MGLKRRAVGRKQVLDLTEKQDSPRRSWQTKYQQICVEHNTQNGDSPEPESAAISSTPARVATNNPLSGLLANYHSDSDSDDDDDKDNAGDLDSKVSDFLKEIQTIVPSGSSLVVPGQLITTPGIVDANASQPQQPVPLSAWQECYDETTGYIYYWHTETNAVTWETPVEYLPQAMAGGQAPDVPPSPEVSSLHHGVTPAAHHEGLRQLPLNMQPWPHQGVPVTYPMMAMNIAIRPQPVQASAMGRMLGKKEMRPLVEYNVRSTDKASSDSEDERIEMITSFGESSDEESEEDIKPPTKKKKPNLEMIGPQLQIEQTVDQEMIGPKFQSCEDVDLQPEADQVDEGSGLLSNQVDDVGPPGVEMETKPEEPSGIELREGISVENSNVGSEQEEGDKETVDTVIQVNENSSSEVDSTTGSVIEPSTTATPMESDGGDSTETDVVGILSRLRSQAKVLKELGGELPAELQELIEPAEEDSAEDVIEKVELELPLEPNDAVISQEELPEQPPELPDFEKEMERMEQELKELTQSTKASSSVESSPKTTSFALIAGYGDDSDQEDEIEKVPIVEPIVQKRTFESLPTAPVKSLFPIADHVATSQPKSPLSVKPEKDSVDVESEQPLNVPLSPKVSHSILFPTVSSSTEVPLPALRLQEPSEGGPETEQTMSPPLEPILDSNLPKKAGKRKKRLDISTSAELVAASVASAASAASVASAASAANAASKAASVTSNTATWTCTTLPEGERKDFGFEKQETDADSFLLDCMNEFESTKVALPKNKENISFVSGDILNNCPKPEDETIEEVTRPTFIEEEKVSEADTRMEEEACRQVGDLAQTIMEKAAFLAEVKEPVSPVQVLAIQIETLVSAWHVGALSRSYLSKWLGKTGDELGQLETSAAPEGWACQWDRSHKRYYYCNLSTGETQWEYPEQLEEYMEPEVTPQPQEVPKVPAVEDIAGGELAMEICNTPPHSPSPPPTPPSPSPPPPPPPPPRLDTPPPPPPPMISESRELSPPPPPRISPFPPPKNIDSRRQKGKNRKKRPPPASKQHFDSKESRKSSPTPPPPDLNPPLPPLPPPPSSPPPPPPLDMPPLPPSPPRQQLAYGEPLPPGVDPGEIPYMAHPAVPQQLVYQPPELSAPSTADMESYQHVMQQTYVMAPYQPAMVQPGMTNVQGGPVMDYSGMPYMMHTHMTMPAVIAKPPAKKHKAALHAALDSFYSDLATMEPTPTPEGVCEAAAVPAPLLEEVSATSEPSIEPEVLLKQADSIAKKKKVKKVVGLGLKKKGVSSLVAKWQQVQQEVRRDFETLDQDNDSCQ